MKTTKIMPSDVKAGDLVMPPAREVRLWMRRDCQDKGLEESALLLTVAEVIEGGKIDKGGPWTYIKARYSAEFGGGREINFFVRPTSPVLRLAA